MNYITDRWANGPLHYRIALGRRVRAQYRWTTGYSTARAEITVLLRDETALVICCQSDDEGNAVMRELVRAGMTQTPSTIHLDGEQLMGDFIHSVNAVLV